MKYNFKHITIKGESSIRDPFGQGITFKLPNGEEVDYHFCSYSRDAEIGHLGVDCLSKFKSNGYIFERIFPEYDRTKDFDREGICRLLKDTLSLDYSPKPGDCPYLKIEDWVKFLEYADEVLDVTDEDTERVNDIMAKYGLLT